MDVEQIREYCLSKPFVEESLPFGPDVLVFKIGGKIFLLLPLNTEQLQFNVKSNPEEIELLRENFSCVLPSYHMNKKHWNTIVPNASVTTSQLYKWIDESYTIVLNSLSKKIKANLL